LSLRERSQANSRSYGESVTGDHGRVSLNPSASLMHVKSCSPWPVGLNWIPRKLHRGLSYNENPRQLHHAEYQILTSSMDRKSESRNSWQNDKM